MKLISNSVITVLVLSFIIFIFQSCNTKKQPVTTSATVIDTVLVFIDTNKIPMDKFGAMVSYGRQLMLNTAYYIGPSGVAGSYTRNKINCTNCHQDAGTKAYSFNLILSHLRYPQYRAREGKVLTLAERVNNCVMRPGNGKPLPLDSKEMNAFLSYLKWISEQAPAGQKDFKGSKNLEVELPDNAADPLRGAWVYSERCLRCHGDHGQGGFDPAKPNEIYPALWGDHSYQPGSSMHRVIKLAQWLKANMPYDSARWDDPKLSDQDALDVAAFINNDEVHTRPNPKTFDYPHPEEKAIDYGKPPFADTFSANQHKYGPYKPIINYWKSKGMKPVY